MSGQRPWRPVDVFWILFWHRVDRILHRRDHKMHCVCYGNREGL